MTDTERTIEDPINGYEDWNKFCQNCLEEAALPFCDHCGGTGEVWERNYWDDSEADEDLIPCEFCKGTGVIK